jgi:hypothetical protein
LEFLGNPKSWLPPQQRRLLQLPLWPRPWHVNAVFEKYEGHETLATTGPIVFGKWAADLKLVPKELSTRYFAVQGSGECILHKPELRAVLLQDLGDCRGDVGVRCSVEFFHFVTGGSYAFN